MALDPIDHHPIAADPFDSLEREPLETASYGPGSSGPDGAGDPLDPLDPPAGLPAGLPPLGASAWRDRVDDLRLRVVEAPIRAVVTVLAVLVAAAVAWWLVRPPGAPPIEAQIPLAGGSSAASAHDPSAGPAEGPPGSDAAGPAGATAPGASTTVPIDLVVQAAGAVRAPGVYRLPAGSRVDDLVAAAGGLTTDADPDRINLAAPVADGERVWLPRRGDLAAPEVVAGNTPPPASPPGSPGGTGTPGSEGVPATVDLNAATATELEALPGVGPATAAAIVAHREQHGPFTTVDQLLDVRGIGEAKLEQIRPMATVG